MTKHLMFFLALLTFAGITDANGAANTGSVFGPMSHSSRLSFITHWRLTRTVGLLPKGHEASAQKECSYETMDDCLEHCPVLEEGKFCVLCADASWECVAD